MFKDFGRRVQRDLKRIVDARLRISEELSQGRIKVGISTNVVFHSSFYHAMKSGKCRSRSLVKSLIP